MKRSIFTIALLAILMISNTTVYAANAASTTATTDTVAKKKFDRGLTNYRFIAKNEWICGITASYNGYNSKDSDIALLLKDFNFTGSLFGVHPYVGYFVSDNNCVGVKLGYSTTSANLNDFNLTLMDDMSISLSNLAYSAKYYSAGIFHRAYLGLTRRGQLGVFNETSLTFTSGTSHFLRGETGNIKDTKTVSSEIALGLNPGISVFILDNISANVSVGILGLNYKHNKQYTDNVESGYYHSSGANFKINILNINIGISVHI